MNKRITFKDMAHSSVLENYVNQQLAKVEQFLTNERSPVFIDVVFEPSKVHAHHKVSLHIKTPHYDLMNHHEGTEFYDMVDRVIDTMYRRLHEAKERRVSDRKMCGRHEEFKKQR